jgi:hypothetical protein
MKPLPRAPLTDEDAWIRKRIAWRMARSVLGAAEYRYALVAADRRDAELMLRAQMNVNRDWSYIRLDSWNAAAWGVTAALELPGWVLVRRGHITEVQ